MKQAISIDEQIELLRSRGVTIQDDTKAEEYLLDIGYYRLGFYLFPFEKSYPKKEKRTHEVIPGTCIEDAVALYYFDADLQRLLSYYLKRIEIAFRTKLIYEVSMSYPNHPTWFASPQIMEREYVRAFEKKVYEPISSNYSAIKMHHRHHINDRYAPAWKTIEFMTFGSIELLYNSILDDKVRNKVRRHFGIKSHKTFSTYLRVCRTLRNKSAHANCLFDEVPFFLIPSKPAGILPREQYTLWASLKVIHYLIGTISRNRQTDMEKKVQALARRLLDSGQKFHSILLRSGKIDLVKLKEKGLQ